MADALADDRPAEPARRCVDAYEVAVRVHLIPGLGAHKLNKLQPEHLERFYTRMQENGSAPALLTRRTAPSEQRLVRPRNAVR